LERVSRHSTAIVGSLDDDVVFDKEAFFPGDKLGALSNLKPADLRSRADVISSASCEEPSSILAGRTNTGFADLHVNEGQRRGPEEM